MRILHIYKDYYPILGGIENHVRTLAETQASKGHRVTVLVTNPAPGMRTVKNEYNGVNLIRAGRITTVASTPLSLALFYWCSKINVDIAHLHFPYPLGEIANLWFKPGQRTVITYHCDVIRQRNLLKLYRPLLMRVLRQADRILPTSPFYMETSPFLQPIQERCEVVPLGVDISRFSRVTQSQLDVVRKRYQFLDGPITLVFVGRLRYYKGLDDLLVAMQSIPETQLLVIGDGPMKGAWTNLVNSLGLDKRVTFTGEVEDEILPACYGVGDIFVLPANSRAEAFGTVIMEAMAMGLPVISTDLGTGTSWVNQNGITGLVIPPRNPKAIADAINHLINHQERCKSMGKAARKRVESEFDQDQMVERIEEIYTKVLVS